MEQLVSLVIVDGPSRHQHQRHRQRRAVRALRGHGGWPPGHRGAALRQHVVLPRHKSSLLDEDEEELFKELGDDTFPGKHSGATGHLLISNSTHPTTQVKKELLQLSGYCE